MAANTTPIMILTPKDSNVRFSTANTNRDGTGTLGTLHTAGTNGSFFKCIRIQAEGTTTAGVVRIYIQSGGSGNNELIHEALVSAITPSTTVQAFNYDWFGPGGCGIALAASSVLKVSTNNAETFSAHAVGGGDY